MTSAEELAALKERLKAFAQELRERDDGSSIAWRVRNAVADELLQRFVDPALASWNFKEGDDAADPG